MLTTRTSGNFTNVAIVGQYSGLDTEAVIEATIAAKRLPAVSLEGQIDENTLESEALVELDIILESFQSIANSLRNPPGLTGLSDDIFQSKMPYLTSSTATDARTVLGISAGPEAVEGFYELEVKQTAKANKLSTIAVPDGSVGLGITDTLTIGLDGGQTANIAISPADSLLEIADSINVQTNTTGVRASILQVNATEHRLILTAEETGKKIQISATSGGFMTTLSSTGLLKELQSADRAVILVDGVEIERTSNEIDDVIKGVMLQLYKSDPGNKITVDIEQDLSGAKGAIEALVEAYNALRSFYDKQRDYDPLDADAVQPPLYDSDILRDAVGGAATIIGFGAIGVDSDQHATLRGIGLTVNDDGLIEINNNKLENALLSDPGAVQELFQFTFNSDDSRLLVLSRKGGVNPGDFAIKVGGVDSSGNVISATVNGESVFDISGRNLTGKEGTDFEGITLFWSGDSGTGTETVSVSSSVGVGEQFYNLIEKFVKPTTGRIDIRLLDIEKMNSDYERKIAAIDARLVVTQQFLIDKYARMEQALAQLEAVRRQLETMARNAGND